MGKVLAFGTQCKYFMRMTYEQKEAHLASRLRLARVAVNKSQQEAADHLRLARQSISDIERCRRSVLALELSMLARLYNTTPEALLKGL